MGVLGSKSFSKDNELLQHNEADNALFMLDEKIENVSPPIYEEEQRIAKRIFENFQDIPEIKDQLLPAEKDFLGALTRLGKTSSFVADCPTIPVKQLLGIMMKESLLKMDNSGRAKGYFQIEGGASTDVLNYLKSIGVTRSYDIQNNGEDNCLFGIIYYAKILPDLMRANRISQLVAYYDIPTFQTASYNLGAGKLKGLLLAYQREQGEHLVKRDEFAQWLSRKIPENSSEGVQTRDDYVHYISYKDYFSGKDFSQSNMKVNYKSKEGAEWSSIKGKKIYETINYVEKIHALMNRKKGTLTESKAEVYDDNTFMIFTLQKGKYLDPYLRALEKIGLLKSYQGLSKKILMSNKLTPPFSVGTKIPISMGDMKEYFADHREVRLKSGQGIFGILHDIKKRNKLSFNIGKASERVVYIFNIIHGTSLSANQIPSGAKLFIPESILIESGDETISGKEVMRMKNGHVEVLAQKGDGIYTLLDKVGLRSLASYGLVQDMNEGVLGTSNALKLGKYYVIPLDVRSLASGGTLIKLMQSYGLDKKYSRVLFNYNRKYNPHFKHITDMRQIPSGAMIFIPKWDTGFYTGGKYTPRDTKEDKDKQESGVEFDKHFNFYDWIGSVKPIEKYKDDLAGYVFVLDPGHGGADPGTRGFINGKVVIYEAPYAMDITYRLAKYLKQRGAIVEITTFDTSRGITYDDHVLLREDKAQHSVYSYNTKSTSLKRQYIPHYTVSGDDQQRKSLHSRTSISSLMTKKYKNKKVRYIAIHIDSAKNLYKPIQINYNLYHKKGYTSGKRFAKSLKNTGLEYAGVPAQVGTLNSRVINYNRNPSILIEIGNINHPTTMAHLMSETGRQKYVDVLGAAFVKAAKTKSGM